MLSDTAKALITLVKSAINRTAETLPKEPDAKELITLCKRHHISEIVYTGAINCGIDKSHPYMKQLFLMASRNALSHELQQKELQTVTEVLKSAGADYMLLKGCLLKDLYPTPSMRVMGDIDILVKPESLADIEKSLSDKGYTKVTESTHEYILKSKSGVTLELHKMLIPSYNSDFFAYFGTGWDRAIPCGDHAFRLSDEDMFIYLFTHFAKHYRDGGIGIKHLTDIYLFLKINKPDPDYIRTELSKLSLWEFYKNIAAVIGYWFENGESSPKTEHISEIIIGSGAYGSRRARLYAQSLRTALTQEKSMGGMGLMIRNTFPPLSAMSINYKYLRKAPVLLPVAWSTRLCRILLHKRKLVKGFAADAKAITKQDIRRFYDAISYVGLDFNFKEQDK